MNNYTIFMLQLNDLEGNKVFLMPDIVKGVVERKVPVTQTPEEIEAKKEPEKASCSAIMVGTDGMNIVVREDYKQVLTQYTDCIAKGFEQMMRMQNTPIVVPGLAGASRR